MSRDLVSIVIPVWRPDPDWLRAAVTSALEQRDCEVEVVVVDDGSPDDAVTDLIAGMGDSRLRVERVPRGGVSRARNAGIELSRGRTIRFADGDDVLEPGSTARLLRLMQGRDDRVSYGSTLFCDEQLRPMWTMRSGLQGNVARACLLGRFTVRAFSMLFPRRLIEEVGSWDAQLSVSEDWDFVLRAVERADVTGTREIATLYRRHPGSASRDVAAGMAGADRVVSKYFERHPAERGSALEREARAMLAARAARVHLAHGDPRSAFGHFQIALRLAPTSLLNELRPLVDRAAGSTTFTRLRG